MQDLLFLLTVAAAAAAFAALEVQIEGDAGWAASLPTWRYEGLSWLLGGRPLTGYHLYCHAFVLIAAHLPYGFGFVAPSLRAEARILAFVILFWIVEDFLWFVINPAYGVRGFTKARATWHAHAWWWFMPREYWIFLPAGIGLYVFSRA